MSERNDDERRPTEDDVRPEDPEGPDDLDESEGPDESDDPDESEGSGEDRSGGEPADAASGEPGSEGPAGDEEDPKPISVRDLMPSASSRPRRRSRPRGESEAPGAPEETDETDDTADEEGSGGSRPTPVRIAMDRPPPGDSRPAEELPSRRFEAEGEDWIVRITGRTITGSRPDSGALLMQLVFCRVEEPETPRRELLTVDRPLEALYEEDLQEFLERSRPTKGEGE